MRFLAAMRAAGWPGARRTNEILRPTRFWVIWRENSYSHSKAVALTTMGQLRWVALYDERRPRLLADPTSHSPDLLDADALAAGMARILVRNGVTP